MAPFTASQANNLKRNELEKGISTETTQIGHHWLHGGLRFEKSVSNFAWRQTPLTPSLLAIPTLKHCSNIICNRTDWGQSLNPQTQGLSLMFPLLRLLVCKTSSPYLQPITDSIQNLILPGVRSTDAWGCDRTHPPAAARTIRHRKAALTRPPGAPAAAAREPARGQGLAWGQVGIVQARPSASASRRRRAGDRRSPREGSTPTRPPSPPPPPPRPPGRVTMDGSPRAAASRPFLTHVEPLRRRSGPPRSAALAALALPPPPGSTSKAGASKQSAPRPRLPPFRHTGPGSAPGEEGRVWERDPLRALPGHPRAGSRAGRKVWRIKPAAPGPACDESAAAGARGGRGPAASPACALPAGTRSRAANGTLRPRNGHS